MNISRRAVTALATVAVTVTTASVLGLPAQSDATPAPTAATVAPGNPKVPNARPCCGITYLRPGYSLSTSNPAGRSMMSGGLGGGPDNVLATFSRYRLELQDDGNMVEYDGTDPATRHAVWSTGTRGAAAPITLTMQGDGNVVLRDRTGKAVWATGTAGRATAYFDVYGNGQVVAQDSTGHVLSAFGPARVGLPGFEVQGAVSPASMDGGQYRALVPQSDGNLVEYVGSGTNTHAVWSSGTAGAGPVTLSAQSDGNLVLRQNATGRAVWASGSHGPTAYYQLDAQDDGNVVLYRTDGIRRVQAVWAVGIRH